MKIIWVLGIILLIGCSRNRGIYESISIHGGANIELLPRKKFIKEVASCFGDEEIFYGKYRINNGLITFYYDKIITFKLKITKKKRNDDYLELSVHCSDEIDNKDVKDLVVILKNDTEEIEGKLTNDRGECSFQRVIINQGAKIILKNMFYDETIINIPNKGDISVNVLFQKKNRIVRRSNYRQDETYEIIKFTKDTLILKPMELGHELYYIKKRSN